LPVEEDKELPLPLPPDESGLSRPTDDRDPDRCRFMVDSQGTQAGFSLPSNLTPLLPPSPPCRIPPSHQARTPGSRPLRDSETVPCPCVLPC
jgi:hypothetical protein